MASGPNGITGIIAAIAPTAAAGIISWASGDSALQSRQLPQSLYFTPVWPTLGTSNVAVDSRGTLFLSDGRYLARASASGTPAALSIIGMPDGTGGDGGPAASARFDFPRAVAVDLDGNLLVAEFGSGRIRNYPAGQTLRRPQSPPMAS